MKVLVCGGRDYADRDHLNNTLDYLHQQHNFTLLIQGAARGADAPQPQADVAIRRSRPMYRLDNFHLDDAIAAAAPAPANFADPY